MSDETFAQEVEELISLVEKAPATAKFSELVTIAGLSLVKDFVGVDLSGEDLSGDFLSDANLSNAHLSSADLSHSNLSGADLSSADLSSANLWNADLSNANLSGANLSNANLRHANLSCADVSDAKLSRADLSFATVQGTRFRSVKGLSEDTRLDLKRRGANFEDSLRESETMDHLGNSDVSHQPIVQPSPRRNSLRIPRLTMPESWNEGDRTLIFVFLSFAACAVLYEIVVTGYNRTHPQEPLPTIYRQLERAFGVGTPHPSPRGEPSIFRSPQHR